jgi:hypothetical protein
MRLKFLLSVLVMMVLVCGIAAPVAATPLYDEIKDQTDKVGESIVPGAGGDQDAEEIISQVETQITNIVVTVRVIAAIAAVIFVIWIGIVFFTSGGNPIRLAQAKTQVALFFVSLICIFAAEPIVRFILSWFIDL